MLSWLADAGRLARWGEGVLAAQEVRSLADSFAGAGFGDGATGAPPGRLSVADVALLDELAALLGHPPRQGSTGPRRDPYQVAPGVRELTTNYRNSVEIFDLATSVIRRVAPDALLPTPVRATGVPPVTRVVTPEGLPGSVRSAAAELLDEVEGTVGVITPAGRRDQVGGWLGEPDPARLQVVTALEAKGMEYDGVVLVEPGEVEQESGARTLHVALSRATQRLTTIASAPWRH